MTTRCFNAVLLLFLTFSMPTVGQNARSSQPTLCEEVVTTVYPEWHAWISPREKQKRVEVRNCQLGEWGTLQIVAWRNDSLHPSLVVETNRTTVVKVAMVGDVFVLETAGASSNVVQVVLYENGTPRLALIDSIRAYARIDMSWKKVVVGLPQEEGPEKVYEFPTGMN